MLKAKELYGIKIVRFESPVYYANVEYFKDMLYSITAAKASTPSRNLEEIIIEGDDLQKPSKTVEKYRTEVTKTIFNHLGLWHETIFRAAFSIAS